MKEKQIVKKGRKAVMKERWYEGWKEGRKEVVKEEREERRDKYEHA